MDSLLTGLAQLIIWVFALWLVGVGALCLIYPKTALASLSKFASSNLINYTELGIRLVVGLAFMGAAQISDYPEIFKITGWFLAVTAVIIMLIPRHWHAEYSVFWARRIPVWAVRVLGPISAALGLVLMGLSI